jgi:hypothetical protein
LLVGWQRARGECNHHGIVTGQDDVDPDDFHQTNPEVGALQQFHSVSPVRGRA